jgi:hypothetical protein
VSHFLSKNSAGAMQEWLQAAHGYFGQYLYNIPQTVQLRLLGLNGGPLRGATVTVYQQVERSGIGKGITDQVKAEGTADANGVFTLPNVHIDPTLVPPAGTGDTLHDNPFGYVDVVGNNGTLLFRVEYNGRVDYAWLDVAETNVAYWGGRRTVAVFDRHLALGGKVQLTPPAELSEPSAGDWSAWAEGANAQAQYDTSRTISGTASLRFTTDGGFDTAATYPGNRLAQWDLTSFQFLHVAFYAENPNLGFQNGSPWIRLKDANGNYFQYQYYVDGNPFDILNDARGTWRQYDIPLQASSTVENGWRRTVVGTPQLSSIVSLEIHSDTWDYGFTLWIDAVSFITS